jgi:DNA-binding XRE family transcriptional regulator
MDAVLVKNADRMMTSVVVKASGLEVTFADGMSALIPFRAIPEIRRQSAVREVELPNPYTIVVHVGDADAVEIPWDFARHHGDPHYRRRVEEVGAAGRQALGERIRGYRESLGLTQEQLASDAGLGRVTLVRIESGEQSPRYETLARLAAALQVPLAGLLATP